MMLIKEVFLLFHSAVKIASTNDVEWWIIFSLNIIFSYVSIMIEL